MSLLRLLSTGKSLVGVTDAESRYRVTRERLLPQFGSPKNPFMIPRKSEPAPAGARRGADCASNGASGGGRGLQDASGASATARAKGALRLKAAALVIRCKAKIGGWLPHPRSTAVKPAIPRFTQPPVQGELSLDKIQVVRNDLRDADLEIVAGKAPARRATKEDSGAETALGRVTARILGVRKP